MIENLEDQILAGCRFCNPPEKERILYESDNFYIMLSLGPIVEGYLLLVSKSHTNCCANIQLDTADEFGFLYDKIRTVHNQVYGCSSVFEHGRAGSCLLLTEGSKHCYHAHMHFLPLSSGLNNLVSKDFDSAPLLNLHDFRRSYREEQPYLYVQDDTTNIYFVDEVIRRQYLRHKASTMINKPDAWDWVSNQEWDLIYAGKNKLAKHFS